MARRALKSAKDAPRDGETGADAVARYVRRLVFEGALTEGQRLPQDDIAAAIGVSRIPVREAIIVLEREGWIHVIAHRGAFVNVLDEQAVLDRFALYSRFYGFAARRAIDRMTLEACVSLAALAGEIDDAANPTAFERANGRYLSALVHLAGSNRLIAVLRSTSQIVPGNFFAVIPNAMAIQKAGIADLQLALTTGDAAAAEQIFASVEDRLALEVIALMNQRRSQASSA
jgi:DNA-binding GntR family transcriptional regulator